MNMLVHVLLSVMLLSCTAAEVLQSPTQHFVAYREIVYDLVDRDESLINRSKPFYSSNYWKEQSKGIDNSILEKQKFVDFMLKFPLKMTRIEKTIEVVSDNSACLLIQGYNYERVPMDYLITYIKEKKHWKINETNATYYTDGATRYFNDPVCDENERNRRFLESTMESTIIAP